MCLTPCTTQNAFENVTISCKRSLVYPGTTVITSCPSDGKIPNLKSRWKNMGDMLGGGKVMDDHQPMQQLHHARVLHVVRLSWDTSDGRKQPYNHNERALYGERNAFLSSSAWEFSDRFVPFRYRKNDLIHEVAAAKTKKGRPRVWALSLSFHPLSFFHSHISY